MKKTSKTVVFFGSGPVAAESLRKLHEDFNIEAVITKPRAPHHKGSVPVIELAESLGLQLHTADSKLSLDKLFAEKEFNSELGILIDFGIIVSQKVIDYFNLGIVNSHFSILPEWRGADPITFALLSGQKTTGVSLMLLVEKMDEGPLLRYEEISLDETYDAQKLTEKLIQVSHNLLCTIIPKYCTGDVEPFAQIKTGREVSYSRKITVADAKLDFTKNAEDLEREIRAFTGWPGSKIEIKGKSIIVTKAHLIDEHLPAGVMKIQNKNELVAGTATQSLSIDEVRPAGKNTMPIKAFLAGNSKLFQ